MNQRLYLTKQGNDITGFNTVNKAITELSDGRWIVDIKRQSKKRTLPQNALLHVYFQIIADETGNSLEIVKSILKKEFLTVPLLDKEGNEIFNPKTGELVTYVRNTSDDGFSTYDMMEFIDKIRVWALDWGIILPLPGENTELKF